MATVKFSDQLKHEILGNADGLFGDRLRKANQPVPEEFARPMWIDFFNKYATAFSTLPDNFFHIDKELSVGTNVVSVNFTKFVVPRVPPAVNYIECERFSYRPDRWSSKLMVTDHPENQAYIQEAKRISQGIQAVREERDAFKSGVDKLIKSYSTLAPALKQWPPLWDLLPQKTQDRHKLVITRTKNDKAAENLTDVDFDSMTSKVVTSKLLGS